MLRELAKRLSRIPSIGLSDWYQSPDLGRKGVSPRAGKGVSPRI